MNKTITTLVILISFISNSQCIKGDCDNGIGTKKYERGLKGKYEGQFKDKLPEGKGKFTYSDFGHNFDNVSIACLNCNLRRRTMYHGRFTATQEIKNVVKIG